MIRRYSTLSGFVLAGGESRRMGQPKHRLVLGGETMLDRQVRLLQAVSRSVAVVGAPPGIVKLEVPALSDDIPGRGPLGGIYTALLRTRAEYNLIVGCDLPFLEARFLSYLARVAREFQADVTVPEDKQGRLQPLCAIYRRRALSVVRVSLQNGENKTSGFFGRVTCRVVTWREVARAGRPSQMFVNMNTPEDLEAARRRIEPATYVASA